MISGESTRWWMLEDGNVKNDQPSFDFGFMIQPRESDEILGGNRHREIESSILIRRELIVDRLL